MRDLDDLFDLVDDVLDRDAFDAEIAEVEDAFHGLLDERACALYVVARHDRLPPTPEDHIAPGREANFEGAVRQVSDVRTFQRSKGTGQVLNVMVATGTDQGEVRVTLWDDDAEEFSDLSPGELIRVESGIVKKGRYGIEVHKGRFGTVTRVGGAPAGEGADLAVAGKLEERQGTRTFAGPDGETKFVATVRVDDGNGGREVTLWGDAVREMASVPVGREIKLSGLVEREGRLHSTAKTRIDYKGPRQGLDAFLD